jgi:hypothetical protein
MAQIVGVYNATHSPFCFMPPEKWDAARAARTLRADVPVDSLDENRRKYDRLQSALATLRERIAAARPDVAIVFASDQLESFDFKNFPSIAVYAGEAFDGRALSEGVPDSSIPREGNALSAHLRLTGHPQLAGDLVAGLLDNGFDPAFCMEMPNPERGVAHGLVWKAQSLTGIDMPFVPVLLNCHYAPQVSGARCFQLGKAVRRVVESLPSDLRVAVLGTGGLWHTPGAKDAYLDEAFDRAILQRLEAGDIEGMARHFDSYLVPEGDVSQTTAGSGRDTTGMRRASGPQGGTRQTCNWIAAAGVSDTTPTVVVDYVPVYASPIGAAFTYCDNL